MEFDGQIKHSECRSTADSVFFSVFLFLSGVCFFFNFFTSSFFFFFDSSKKTSPITKDERLSLQPSFFLPLPRTRSRRASTWEFLSRTCPFWQDKSSGLIWRAESQKIAVWIWTALPCTTPRPALESSTNDLASDLWVLAQLCSCAYFSRVKRKRRTGAWLAFPWRIPSIAVGEPPLWKPRLENEAPTRHSSETKRKGRNPLADGASFNL